MTRRVRVFFVVGVEVKEPATSPEDRALARDLLRKLRFATTPERWEAWIAHAEGKTLADIAEDTDVPIGTIATRIALARRDFAAAIRRLRALERRGPR